MKNATSTAERFWPKVQRDGPVPPACPELGQCWIWLAGVTAGGYGMIGLGSRGAGKVYAHRFAYQQIVGPIPDGLHLDHLCRVTRCVNPAHLEAVAPAVNKLRGVSPNAVNAKKTRCDHGHPFDRKNTYIRPNGQRDCRACNRNRALARRAGRAPA